MNIAYFPGCSVHSMAGEYDRSARLVCNDLDVHLEEVTDWNCCGATAAHSVDRALTLRLNGRNLATVRSDGLRQGNHALCGLFQPDENSRIGAQRISAREAGHP